MSGARKAVGAAGTVGGLGLGLLLTLICAAAGTTVVAPAEGAGPGGADGGAALSSFVAHAQRGEVEPPDIDDVEHMCALLTSCDKLALPSGWIPPDFQSCVKKFTEDLTSPSAVNFSLTIRECGLQSNSCAALRSCALHGASPDSCQGRGHAGVVGFCDVDGRALSCWHDQVLSVVDCGRGNEQCIVAGGDSKCVLGPCPGNIKDGDKPVCANDGAHKLQCEKGKLVSRDCGVFGLKCTTGADGAAACATSSPACTGNSKRCDGNTAVGCFNGHEVRVDCAAAGLSCNSTPGSTPVGACVSTPPANGCDPSTPAKCDGASIKHCYGGKPRAYFCKALGFNKCDSSGKGVRCAM